ncbi:hypothetical protein SSTU70S_06455 [Stutzerimonas stutzeri]
MRDLNNLPDLELALVQTSLVWQDAPANRERFAAMLEQARGADLVILPEMFTRFLDGGGGAGRAGGGAELRMAA